MRNPYFSENPSFYCWRSASLIEFLVVLENTVHVDQRFYYPTESIAGRITPTLIP